MSIELVNHHHKADHEKTEQRSVNDPEKRVVVPPAWILRVQMHHDHPHRHEWNSTPCLSMRFLLTNFLED